MPAAQRLKPYFFPCALAVGIGLAWLLSPLDWIDGIVLFVLGSAVGGWDRQLNPNGKTAEGPILPWDDMHAGDRLAYFLPAAAIAIAGLVFLGMAIHLSRTSIEWGMVTSASLCVGAGIAAAYWKWAHRNT